MSLYLWYISKKWHFPLLEKFSWTYLTRRIINWTRAQEWRKQDKVGLHLFKSVDMCCFIGHKLCFPHTTSVWLCGLSLVLFLLLSTPPNCSAVKKFQNKHMCSWNRTLKHCWRAYSKAASPAKIIKDLLSGWNSWLIAYTCQCQTTINREIWKKNKESLYNSNEIKRNGFEGGQKTVHVFIQLRYVSL